MRITRIHHITIAVRDVEGARITFEQLFGERASDPVHVPAFGVKSATLPLGESTLEVAAPVAADNPVMRFLERRGEGFYNLALEVEDLDAAIEELVALGVRVSEPIEPEPGLRSSFVTMTATHGLSVQLVEVVGARTKPAVAAATAARPAPISPAPDEPPRAPVAMPLASKTPTSEEQIRLDGVPHGERLESEAEAPPASAVAGDTHEQPPLDLTPDEWSDVD